MQTLATIALGFLILSVASGKDIFLYVSCAMLTIALFLPSLTQFIERCWLSLAVGLGFVNSRVILSIVFIVFLVPLAGLRRLVTKTSGVDSKSLRSSFVNRDHRYTEKDFVHTW